MDGDSTFCQIRSSVLVSVATPA